VKPIEDFDEQFRDLYATYHHATDGFRLKFEEVKAQIDKYFAALPSDKKFTNRLQIGYPRLMKPGAPLPFVMIENSAQVLAKNAFQGPNTVFLGRMLIVSLYSFWENARKKISVELGLNEHTEEISTDFIGELRHLRIFIVHDKSRVDSTKVFNILQWVKAAPLVSPDREQIFQIVDECHMLIEALRADPRSFVRTKIRKGKT
jgi:hypothetical protein